MTEFGYEKNNKFKIYQSSERPVRIWANGDSTLGYINNVGTEFLSILPVLVPENLPNPDGSWDYNYNYEKHIPSKINYNDIRKVEPLRKGYLEKLIDATSKVKEFKSKEQKSTNQ